MDWGIPRGLADARRKSGDPAGGVLLEQKPLIAYITTATIV